MKQILVEFYSKRTPENLISLLKGKYDGAFFLFFPESSPEARIRDRITDVVKELLGFTPEFICIPDRKLNTILDFLTSVSAKWDRTVIDITGGNEVFIAAAGVFLSRAEEGKVLLHQYHVPSGKKIFSYPETTDEAYFPRCLSVPQILSLGGTPPLSAPVYSFSVGPLRKETLRLWEAVKKHSREWNAFSSLPTFSESKNKSVMKKEIGYGGETKRCYAVISAALKEAGILKDETETITGKKRFAKFRLDVPEEALFLYKKAGNVLEAYGALAAFDAGLFHDVRVGVTVDWNGSFAPPKNPDPRNEIDLILMRENLPILGSCKNTYPQKEYLYEIMTMARHYGGYFSTPLLLSTEAASPTVRQRAKEMEIVLIDSVRNYSLEELTLVFQKVFR